MSSSLMVRVAGSTVIWETLEVPVTVTVLDSMILLTTAVMVTVPVLVVAPDAMSSALVTLSVLVSEGSILTIMDRLEE